ncbi:hypothetical protein EON65_47885 [archaeon]|nr:MAG: hypothetical protein EON65_47885 [archaeon]
MPKCAPGCADSWIGDGYCDKACNVSECNFDFPDCVNGSNVAGNAYTNTYQTSYYATQCSTGCPDSWLGDKICDLKYVSLSTRTIIYFYVSYTPYTIHHTPSHTIRHF